MLSSSNLKYPSSKIFSDFINFSSFKTEIIFVDGLIILPFGDSSERMFENRNIGASTHNLNFNIHTNQHLIRASLEGIAFSFIYAMEILMNDNFQPKLIRAGNDNLFQSELFSNTISTVLGQQIEIHDVSLTC